MQKFLLFSVLIISVLTVSCSEKNTRVSDKQIADSLLASVEKKIQEKIRMSELRTELENSSLGRSIDKYKPIIKKYAKRYGFDWRLIAAQIVQESGFKEKARSRVGALGLMQIMPGTAREISNELDFQFILKNPRENITAGIYHLHKQYRYFPESQFEDRTRLALAAYNSGAGRVFDAQEITRFKKHPSGKWDYVKPSLTLLKKSDWELHLQIWPNGQPKYGYFYGSDETIQYVERIWNMYHIYKLIL
jgi:membrane-bound lytic murein transglycosylase F